MFVTEQVKWTPQMDHIINKIFYSEIKNKKGPITEKKIKKARKQFKKLNVDISTSSVKSTVYNIIKGKRRPFVN